jgi:DNA-binding transcriptional LysR family regulator
VPKRQKRRREPVFEMETRVLRSVIAVADKLSFTKAERKLGISQPALSKQIAELENRFDFNLFARTNKRDMEITDAGRVFVEKARSLLNRMELTVRLTRDFRVPQELPHDARLPGNPSLILVIHERYPFTENFNVRPPKGDVAIGQMLTYHTFSLPLQRTESKRC